MGTILITGVTGFLGSHLALKLIEDGHTIIGIKRKDSSCRRIASFHKRINLVNIDDLNSIDTLLNAEGINSVIHCATSYGVRGETASELFQANVAFPMKVMEIARNFGVKYFYNFDTYFNSSKGIYSYLSEYTLTKKQFSEWGLYYSKKFEIQFINIRLEHLYGPEDGGAKFIPWLIGRCFDGSKIINLTEGEQLRDFLYVSDAVNAVALLIKNQSIFDPHYQCIGLGSGSLTSIKELALMVHALTKSKGVLCFGGLDYRENELMSSFSDAAKFRALGWYPKTSLECGLMNTIINFRKSKK